MKKATRREDENKERREREIKCGRKIWWCLVKVITSLERIRKLGLEKEE